MANQNHVKTAHQWGVQEALRRAGYGSIDEVNKEAQDLGLLEEPQTTNEQADLGALFRSPGR